MHSDIAVDTSDQAAEQPAPQLLRAPELAGGHALKGHLHELAHDNQALFRRCAELGGLVRFRIYWFTCHVLTDPSLASELLITRASSFMKTRGLQIARPTFGNGLLTSEGDTWRRQQRLMRAFFTPKAAEGYGPLIEDCIERRLATWSEGGVVDLHSEMIDVSLEFVCRALFGLDASRLQPLIRDAAAAVQEWHGVCQDLCLPYPHYYPMPANFRYRSRSRALNRAVYALIRDVRASGGDEHGLLGALLRVRDEDGSGISDREIRDQLVTLFLAGHETTAASLALTLYELCHRPDLQARVASESDSGKSEADVPSECLEQVIKETLRLHAPVHLVARTAIEDVRLGPYLVKRREEVVLPVHVLQRSSKLFKRAEEFVPERWADEAKGPICPRHAFLPFSSGPRVCIGQAIAL
ncbi:MAG TPA: cytochrome P450, partial [Polyangiaceae bacterium]|nr:cytochrome P450 [Polyangiaceae bacterium]